METIRAADVAPDMVLMLGGHPARIYANIRDDSTIKEGHRLRYRFTDCKYRFGEFDDYYATPDQPILIAPQE